MTEEEQRERLRRLFDGVAEAYDRARPGYPEAVIDELVSLAGLEPRDPVLEIGCGTGQATLPLARRGLSLTAVELGPGLAAVARRKLAAFPDVRVETADFETWPGPQGAFAAVVAFTAFHWIDPAVAYARAAALLRPHGALVVVQTAHVLECGGDAFFAEVQADYDAVVPSEHNAPPGPPDAKPDLRAQIDGSGLFETTAVRRHVWHAEYTAETYLALLDTYSGHLDMEDARRRELYRRIRERVDRRPGGRVRKTYLTILNVARAVTAGG